MKHFCPHGHSGVTVANMPKVVVVQGEFDESLGLAVTLLLHEEFRSIVRFMDVVPDVKVKLTEREHELFFLGLPYVKVPVRNLLDLEHASDCAQ